jgi:hypothetical protein
MALGKIVGAGVAGLGLVGVGYAGLAGQDETTRNDAGEVVEGGELGAFRIRVGDCFVDTLEGSFEAVDAVPCSQPHKSEVYAAFMLPGDGDAAFPGEASVQAGAEQGCYDRFTRFVGVAFESSIYGFGTITPTEVSWDDLDDREVLCMISLYDGSLKTGSAENARQ